MDFEQRPLGMTRGRSRRYFFRARTLAELGRGRRREPSRERHSVETIERLVGVPVRRAPIGPRREQLLEREVAAAGVAASLAAVV